jgi:hypothetical protein
MIAGDTRVTQQKKAVIPAEKLELHKKLIATNPKIERKGDLSLDSTFEDLKTILARYARWFAVREGMVRNKRDYHLVLEKPAVIDGRPQKELWFASIIQQKDSVGFYFSPPDVKNKLSPELLAHLDGKSCFHFKTLTPALKKDVEAGLKLGLEAYRKRKWI